MKQKEGIVCKHKLQVTGKGHSTWLADDRQLNSSYKLYPILGLAQALIHTVFHVFPINPAFAQPSWKQGPWVMVLGMHTAAGTPRSARAHMQR